MPAAPSASAASVSEPYREVIENGLAAGRDAMSIWQELVDRHGFTGAYESVKRFVRKLRGPASPEARAVITTPPGEEAQVDYGTGPTIRDPVTGKYRRSRLFVLTLGYSRKCVRLLTFQSSTRIWAELHERAFRKLGGAVKIIVLRGSGSRLLQRTARLDWPQSACAVGWPVCSAARSEKRATAA
jgi:transposase